MLHPDLVYHIGSECRNGKSVLIIRLSQKEERKELLLAKDPQEKKALAFLIQEDLRRAQNLAAFSHFEIGSNKAYEALKLLSLTRKLHFAGVKLFFDPFLPLLFSYAISASDQNLVEIRGEWKGGKDRGWIDEAAWFFPSDPPLLIKHSTLYAFAEGIDLQWYVRIHPQPFVTTIIEVQRWQKIWEKDPSFAPSILFKTEVKELLSYTDTAPLPSLELTCRTGAFANLWMNYPGLGKFRLDDPLSAPLRDLKGERAWERDLLETDFLKKIVGKSHYYCPLDQVAKSLTFLLEIGWCIQDYQGRNVVRQKGQELDIQLQEHHLLLKGKIDYASHSADLAHLIGAFNRQEQFLSLDANTVGLIDRSQVEEDFGGVIQEEISREGILLKKNRFAQLGGLMKEVPLPESFSQLLQLTD
ncbi:MAG: hypothetical protein HYZ48_05520, partial [Chlamydiales bacterium]|nr:hypothetical protein [Chlamydiales bacterium]